MIGTHQECLSMCGIFGFTGAPQPEILAQMGVSLIHRGPDDLGLWESTHISFGIRRLSIIDLETGKQPIQNETGSIWAVFNGEIYNHIELRKELVSLGHVFRTDHADSEVIVHGYEEWGMNFLHRLNGMFAIALYDISRQQLHLARDRMGIKPLYFTLAKDQLIFASEIKAILKHPKAEKKPNFIAFNHYFSFKNIPAPFSAFENIEQLRPGERIVFHGKKISRTRWWQIQFKEDQSLDEVSVAQEIRRLLEESVRLQMRSDVPVGAYLSGGLDSSSIVALMSKMTHPSSIKTFTLAYEDFFDHKEADRTAALRIAQYYGTDHHELVISHKDILLQMDSIIEAFDEPFSGVTSTYFLTGLISKYVKVALSGDGADELFASYLPHRLAFPLSHWGILRTRKNTLTPEELSLLEPFSQKLDFLEKIYRLNSESERRMEQYVWTDSEKNSFYSPMMRELTAGHSSRQLIETLYSSTQSQDPLNRALFVDLETLLPDQVLAFVDRLSMAHSVESRPPFLDHHLVEFLACIPGEMKIKSGRVKHILKQAVHDLLPNELVNRPKEGFVLPVNTWLLKDLKPKVEEILSPQKLRHHGLFNENRIKIIIFEFFLNRQMNGAQIGGAKIWNLMMFQLWWEKYFV